MTLPTGYRFQQLGTDDLRDVLTLDAWAFPNERDVEAYLDGPIPIDLDRTVGVVADVDDPDAIPVDGAVPVRSELVGLRSSYAFGAFPVPGGTAPAGGLTWVGVHPGHRRRGLLTAMMDDHFRHCLRRREPVSVLTASEASIYGRFGYGQAASDVRLVVGRGAALRDVPGSEAHTVRLEVVDPARHGPMAEDLHRRAGDDVGGTGLNRPGWVGRSSQELMGYWWTETGPRRGAREAERIVIVERDGEARGYATYRRTLDWQFTGPDGEVGCEEIVALDAAAAHALWRALLDMDLTGRVRPFLLPVDDVLTSLLVDLRATTPTVHDNVWVRVLDVPAALAARQYAGDVDVVLDVHDDRLRGNTGRWRLRAGAFAAGAVVERTDAPADLTLDVRDLGAVYLGGSSLAALAAAGLVTAHRPDVLARASAAFSWPVAPCSSWIF